MKCVQRRRSKVFSCVCLFGFFLALSCLAPSRIFHSRIFMSRTFSRPYRRLHVVMIIMLQRCNVINCKLMCVELYTSRNTLSPDNHGIGSFRFRRFNSVFAHNKYTSGRDIYNVTLGTFKMREWKMRHAVSFCWFY